MEIQKMSEQEWEVLDYYGRGGEEEDKYEEEEQKWWKFGYWAKEGTKKLAMTGIVISSAPLVLPPLLLVSSLGLAMSIPFGVVFASYACTQKLMTKLLPLPPEKEIHEMRLEWAVDDEINHVHAGGEKTRRLGEERDIEVKSPHHQDSSTSTSSENENGSSKIDEETMKNEDLDSQKIKQEVILMNDDAATSSLPNKQRNKTTQLCSDHDPEHREVGESETKKVDVVVVNGESDKELEPKIWEKIDAIRVIVGFKAPRRSSYLEEVKALYLFTGIDPPSPSTSTSDLDNNLCFLMSVIGLK